MPERVSEDDLSVEVLEPADDPAVGLRLHPLHLGEQIGAERWNDGERNDEGGRHRDNRGDPDRREKSPFDPREAEEGNEDEDDEESGVEDRVPDLR